MLSEQAKALLLNLVKMRINQCEIGYELPNDIKIEEIGA